MDGGGEGMEGEEGGETEVRSKINEKIIINLKMCYLKQDPEHTSQHN